jgi:hypothetical protein
MLRKFFWNFQNFWIIFRKMIKNNQTDVKIYTKENLQLKYRVCVSENYFFFLIAIESTRI